MTEHKKIPTPDKGKAKDINFQNLVAAKLSKRNTKKMKASEELEEDEIENSAYETLIKNASTILNVDHKVFS